MKFRKTVKFSSCLLQNWFLALICMVWIGNHRASGHGSAHEQILKLSELIEFSPKDPQLYLQRADLYLAHQFPEAALSDYQRALQIEPDLVSAKLGLGTIQMQMGDFKPALASLNDYIKVVEKDARAWVCRARVYYALGEYQKSVEDYENAIQFTPTPRPEWFLELAQSTVEWLWKDGSDEQKKNAYQNAARKIDAGIEKLGSAVTLELAAMDYERLAGDFDQAILRIEKLMAQARRKESWWIRKADLQRESGDIEAARASYQSALEAIDQLSEARRQLKSVESMKAYAEEQLSMLPISEVDSSRE